MKNNNEELQIKLTNIEESRNFFQSEYSCLKNKVQDLQLIQDDLKNNLELRRVIINNLECQLLSFKNHMDKLKIDNEKKHDNSHSDDYQFMNNVLSRELHDFEMIYEDVSWLNENTLCW